MFGLRYFLSLLKYSNLFSYLQQHHKLQYEECVAAVMTDFLFKDRDSLFSKSV